LSSSTKGSDESTKTTITSSISNTSNTGLTRFSDLLLRLSPLRSLQPDVLEELFFAGLIGNVQIDSVVPYILKMEASEYQSSPFGTDDIKMETDNHADEKTTPNADVVEDGRTIIEDRESN
jgi:hypothetical protein